MVEFLDVVMHDGSLEFRLEEARIPEGSAMVGRSILEAGIRERTGALVMGLREHLYEQAPYLAAAKAAGQGGDGHPAATGDASPAEPVPRVSHLDRAAGDEPI